MAGGGGRTSHHTVRAPLGIIPHLFLEHSLGAWATPRADLRLTSRLHHGPRCRVTDEHHLGSNSQNVLGRGSWAGLLVKVLLQFDRSDPSCFPDRS